MGPRLLHAAVLLVLLLAAVSRAQAPGFKTCITEAGFKYATSVGIEILMKQLSDIQIPDISDDASTPIGHIDIKLSDIKLGSLQIPEATVGVDPATGITASVEGVSAKVTCSWSYREDAWPHISDSGSANIAVSSTSIQVVVAVGESNMRPTVSTKSVDVHVGNLDINLSGGASWLYNIIVSLFSGTVQSDVQSALSQAIQQAIDQNAEQALATLPVVEQVNGFVKLDVGLLAPPLFTASYMTTEHKGEFYYSPHPEEYPGVPVALPSTVDQSQLQMFLSEWTANSLLGVFQQAGRIAITVTPSMVPPQIPYALNTTDTLWRLLAPQLVQQFPNNAMQLYLATTEAPVATLQPAGALVTAVGVMDVQVVLPNRTVVSAFALNITALCAADAAVASNNLTASLEYLNASFVLAHSNVGPVDTSMFNMLVALVLKALVPVANQFLEGGFALPSIQGVALTDAKIYWDDGYLAVATNVTYTPPALHRQEAG